MRFVTAARVVGLLLMVAAIGIGYWLTSAAMFSIEPASAPGMSYEQSDAVLARAGLDPAGRPNAFLIDTAAIRARLLGDPAISDAQVSVSLPDRLAIDITERKPLFAIQRPDSADVYLVDANGLVVATSAASTATALGIPTIDDSRTQFTTPINVGGQIDPTDLVAMLDLAGLTPATLESSATSLKLTVNDDGFVLSAEPQGWQAIFGQYTPNLRPTELIPRQVQCLRALIGANEHDVRTVYLAPLDDACGTYLPDATPVVPTPAPTKSR